jgi:hypothetical protein
MKAQPEFQLQKDVCTFLDEKYPNVLYLSSVGSAFRLTMPQQQRLKSISKRGFRQPDVFIVQANKTYHGFFIELKADSPFKKDGKLKAGEHLEDQQVSINDLRARGYRADFAWDIENIKQTLKEYLNDL